MVSCGAFPALVFASYAATADAALSPRSSQCGANIETLWDRLRHEGGLAALDPAWYDCSTEATAVGQWTCEYYLHAQLQALLSAALGKANRAHSASDFWAFGEPTPPTATAGQAGYADRSEPVQQLEWRVPLAATCDNLEGGAQSRYTSCWSPEQVRQIQADAASPRSGGLGTMPLAVVVPYHKMGCRMWKNMVRVWLERGVVGATDLNFKFHDPHTVRQVRAAADAPYIREEGGSLENDDELAGARKRPLVALMACSLDTETLHERLAPLLQLPPPPGRAPVRALVVLRHFADAMVSGFHFHISNCEEKLRLQGLKQTPQPCLTPPANSSLTPQHAAAMRGLQRELQEVALCEGYKHISDPNLRFRVFTLLATENAPYRMGGRFCNLLSLSSEHPVRFLRYRDIHCTRGANGTAVLQLALTWLFNSAELAASVIDDTRSSICDENQVPNDGNHVASGEYDQWKTSFSPEDMDMMQAYGIPNLASRFGFIPEMPMRAGVSTVPSGCLIDSEKRAETLLPPHP